MNFFRATLRIFYVESAEQRYARIVNATSFRITANAGDVDAQQKKITTAAGITAIPVRASGLKTEYSPISGLIVWEPANGNRR